MATFNNAIFSIDFNTHLKHRTKQHAFNPGALTVPVFAGADFQMHPSAYEILSDFFNKRRLIAARFTSSASTSLKRQAAASVVSPSFFHNPTQTEFFGLEYRHSELTDTGFPIYKYIKTRPLMTWDKVKHHFSGHPEDLIEVIYRDMNPYSWKQLFDWIKDKIIYLNTQNGYIEPHELSFDAYISGEYSYIATIKTASGTLLDLSIIDEDSLDINIALEEIQSAQAFNALLSNVKEIAGVIACENYIICPEFKPDQAFIINGNYL